MGITADPASFPGSSAPNLVPRVFRLFGQRGNAGKTLGTSNFIIPQDFCGKTMETVTEQPIKKIEFFRYPQSLPGVAPLNKKPEDSGYEIVQHRKVHVLRVELCGTCTNKTEYL